MIRSSSTRRKNTWLGNSGNWSPRSPRCLGLCSSPASCRARFCCLPAGCGFTKVSGRISEDSACLWPSDGLLESVWLGRCLLGCGGVRGRGQRSTRRQRSMIVNDDPVVVPFHQHDCCLPSRLHWLPLHVRLEVPLVTRPAGFAVHPDIGIGTARA